MIAKKIPLIAIALVSAAVVPLAIAHTSASDPDVAGYYWGSASIYVNSPTLFPFAPFASASTLCDMEVLDDGTDHSLLDEEDVEGHPTGGLVPDGTFNDGGIGGACHTSDRYSHADYNTPGCDGKAYASDLVSTGSVWVGASCDWKSDGSTRGFSTCIVETAISGANTIDAADCIISFLSSFTSCGSDGTPDSISFNRGFYGVAFVNDAAADGCDGIADTSAYVYVFDYIDEANAWVVPATMGYIWQ